MVHELHEFSRITRIYIYLLIGTDDDFLKSIVEIVYEKESYDIICVCISAYTELSFRYLKVVYQEALAV